MTRQWVFGPKTKKCLGKRRQFKKSRICKSFGRREKVHAVNVQKTVDSQEMKIAEWSGKWKYYSKIHN